MDRAKSDNDNLLVFLAVALGSLIASSFALFYTRYLAPRTMSSSPTPPALPAPPMTEPERAPQQPYQPRQPQQPRRQTPFAKLNNHIKRWFRRKQHRQGDEEQPDDHPPVFCVEDLEVPPPAYVRSRCTPPTDAEMRTLNEQLRNLKRMRESRFGPFEKTLHRADLLNLNSWIKQMERLVEKRAAYDAARRKKKQKAASKSKKRKSKLDGKAKAKSSR